MRVSGQHARTRATEVAPVVAVEETTLLMTMQRVVGRVEVQHDLFGRLLVRLDKHIDQQRVERFAVRDNFLVPVLGSRLRLPQLQTVQRARPR